MNRSLGAMFGHPEDIRSFKEHQAFVLPRLGIGIEFECEDVPFKEPVVDTFANMWELTTDNSLRGEYRYELRTKWPLFGHDLLNAITQLDTLVEHYKGRGYHPNETKRTGTHIHVDVRAFTVEQLTKILAVYGAVEPILLTYIAAHYYDRSDNIYCLPVSSCDDASLGVEAIRAVKAGLKHSQKVLLRNNYKYVSLNVCALSKQGSIEFRTLPAEHRAHKLILWINMIMSVVSYAIKSDIELPQLPQHASALGVEKFIVSVFGEELIKLLQYPNMENEVMSAIRNVQALTNDDDLLQSARELGEMGFRLNLRCSPIENPLIARVNKHYKSPVKDTAKQEAKKKRKKVVNKDRLINPVGEIRRMNIRAGDRPEGPNRRVDLDIFMDEQED